MVTHLCNHCNKAPRIPGSHFCIQCRSLCAKCKENDRLENSPYCAQCKRNSNAKWSRTNKASPEARARSNAKAYANIYLRRGAIERGPCVICGDANTVMHHDDPGQPLEITWVCKAHLDDVRK